MEDVAGNPIVTYASAFIAFLSLLFTALTARKKSEIDESTLVLGKWKELVEAHEQRIRTMQEDFEAYRKNSREEREKLQARVSELEREVKVLREEHATALRDREAQIVARDKEIAGLKRSIIANSQSTAVLLADERTVRDQAPTTSEIAKPTPKKPDGGIEDEHTSRPDS